MDRLARTFPLLPLLLIALLAWTQAGCSSDAQSKSPEEPEVVPAVPVEAASTTTGDIAAYYTGTANLEAEEEAQVVAKAGGIVRELYVEEGQYVRAGTPLVQLDDERLRLELARTEVSMSKLQRAFERNDELHAKQLVSTEEYEQTKSDYETQKAAYDLAKLQVDYTTVRAPIDGVISDRLVKLGNMVQTNQAVFHITGFDPLLAVLHVPERELNKIDVGQEAYVQADALPGMTFAGRIERISPVVDPSTGTFKVTVEVRDASRQLKPGMFTRVQIVYDTHTGALLVPKQAVVREDDAASVFIVQDTMALSREVVIGYENATSVEILEGLSAGDTVITAGQGNLRDSTKVEVIR